MTIIPAQEGLLDSFESLLGVYDDAIDIIGMCIGMSTTGNQRTESRVEMTSTCGSMGMGTSCETTSETVGLDHEGTGMVSAQNRLSDLEGVINISASFVDLVDDEILETYHTCDAVSHHTSDTPPVSY